MNKVVTWCGKNIEEMSREGLLEALRELARIAEVEAEMERQRIAIIARKPNAILDDLVWKGI